MRGLATPSARCRCDECLAWDDDDQAEPRQDATRRRCADCGRWHDVHSLDAVEVRLLAADLEQLEQAGCPEESEAAEAYWSERLRITWLLTGGREGCLDGVA